VTTRLTRTSTSTRRATIRIHCPACQATTKALSVGRATVGKQRKEVVQCLTHECGLTWVPERHHLPQAPTAA
jgi:hypothetical protein